MTDLSTDAIDQEIASRAKEVTAMSATLIELDNHPGLAHVRRYRPTGVTAQRWAVVEQSLAQLWEDLGRMTSILDTARALRERGWRLDDDDRAELTRLLRERPLEASRRSIPLAQRAIAGSGEAVEYVGLADMADRMHATYPAVVEFLDAVDAIDSLIAKGLAPEQKRLDDAGAAGPKEMTELLEISAHDPLSLTPREVEQRISAIAELTALHANWPDALAAAASQLDELRDATPQAAQVRARAEQINPVRPASGARRRRTRSSRGTAVAHHTGSGGAAVATAPDRGGAADRARGRTAGSGPARPSRRTQGTAGGVPGEGGPAGAE